MTKAWRICREPFANLAGDGARMWGGRCNSPGRPLVYAADTPALAVLEVRAHLDLPSDLIPPDYVLLRIDLTGASIETVGAFPPDTVAFGDAWLISRRTAVLRVPSAIVPESTNLLVNPLHPEAAGIAIVGKRAFTFDSRLWSAMP